ncbi:MAG: FAD-dependent oxidoreductase [Capsulimonadaceae bacterium]|nr:FAD-dependent oxidoreductase [Capsulimonadaceae bacterium]
MQSRREFLRSLSLAVVAASTAPISALGDARRRLSADLVVYGATSAGVAAAVQAARLGRSVVLLEPSRLIGGMTASGIGATDIQSEQYCSGFAREFYQRVYKHYGDASFWHYCTRAEFVSHSPVLRASPDKIPIWHKFEPHVASRIFVDMLREAGVRIVMGERLDLRQGVVKHGAKIVSLTMESGMIVSGGVFVDATYEGDLLAKAGVHYTIGRESNEVYGEAYNGVRPGSPLRIDPFVRPGDPSTGLLPGVAAASPGAAGQADTRVQAYNFRLCLTDVPENRVPIVKPDGYDPRLYESMARTLSRLFKPMPPAVYSTDPNHGRILMMTPLPNCKVDLNTNAGTVSADLVGASYAWPDGDYALRDRLWQQHASYTKGLLWFAANDPRMTPASRREVTRWGLAGDEFADTNFWPPHLYVREARRMVSDYVMTEHHSRRSASADDGVAVASYPIDCHCVSYYVGEAGQTMSEGNLFAPNHPFAISFRSIRPRSRECENLLVTCAVSATHVAFSAIRMEPVFMMLGQAAGTAASIALTDRITVQDVPYDRLRAQLRRDGMVLSPLPDAVHKA